MPYMIKLRVWPPNKELQEGLRRRGEKVLEPLRSRLEAKRQLMSPRGWKKTDH